MSVLCVIPARYASTRLPGKPLLQINGRPLVMWAYEAAVRSNAFDTVCVATDHQGIYDCVVSCGGTALMTSSEHERGTDRVFETATNLPHDFIVNLQGDEPDLPIALISDFVQALKNEIDDNYLLTTVSNATINSMTNPNAVKVVLNNQQEALYFSRAGIPFNRTGIDAPIYRHTGIYGFSFGGLKRFCTFPQGILERAESLEQLRALEYGMRIRCLICDYDTTGIDTPEDLEAFRNKMASGLKDESNRGYA